MVYGELYSATLQLIKIWYLYVVSIYSHKETPGLGAEVDNPKWKALWDGKTIYKNDAVEIEVIKGKVDSSNRMASYQDTRRNTDKQRSHKHVGLLVR